MIVPAYAEENTKRPRSKKTSMFYIGVQGYSGTRKVDTLNGTIWTGENRL